MTLERGSCRENEGGWNLMFLIGVSTKDVNIVIWNLCSKLKGRNVNILNNVMQYYHEFGIL